VDMDIKDSTVVATAAISDYWDGYEQTKQSQFYSNSLAFIYR
jgi:hypothetical protein